jgi:hypothetical protein
MFNVDNHLYGDGQAPIEGKPEPIHCALCFDVIGVPVDRCEPFYIRINCKFEPICDDCFDINTFS